MSNQKYLTALYIALDEPDQPAVRESSLLSGTSECIADYPNSGNNFMTGSSSAELIPFSPSTTKPTGMIRNFKLFLGCIPLRESESGFLICGVPLEQIHFQISDLSNPLWTRIYRSLICAILRRIIGSQIQRIPLGEGSEISHFAPRCSIQTSRHFIY